MHSKSHTVYVTDKVNRNMSRTWKKKRKKEKKKKKMNPWGIGIYGWIFFPTNDFLLL